MEKFLLDVTSWYHWDAMLIALGVMILLAIPAYMYGRSKRRHEVKLKQAKVIFKKIKTIKSFPQAIAYLRKIDPYVYEELILYALKVAGYKIKRNKKYSGDGGIDGKVWIKGKLHYVQAKRYSKYINKAHVKEFNFITQRDKVGGLFIHTGITGKGAKEELASHVKMVSGEKMVDLIKGINVL
jgi:restriction system protein